MKKILTLVAALSLVASLAVGGSIAYLSDTEEATNVMTLGNVDIVQFERERKNDTPDATYNDGTVSYSYQMFTQDQKLFPAVISEEGAEEKAQWYRGDDYWTGNYYAASASNPEKKFDSAASTPNYDHNNASYNSIPYYSNTYISLVKKDSIKNYIDKIVSVTNAGDSDAYVRTMIAIPSGGWKFEDFISENSWFHFNYVADSIDIPYADRPNLYDGDGDDDADEYRSFWHWDNDTDANDGGKPGSSSEWDVVKGTDGTGVEIDGIKYFIFTATHAGKLPVGPGSAAHKPGSWYNYDQSQTGYRTAPNLLGFYMDPHVDSDEENGVTKWYYKKGATVKKEITNFINDEGKVPVLVASQAVQTEGFENAWQALEAGFGAITEKNHPWAVQTVITEDDVQPEEDGEQTEDGIEMDTWKDITDVYIDSPFLTITDENTSGNGVYLENIDVTVENGPAIIVEAENSIFLKNCNFNLDDGQMVLVDNSNAATQVYVNNVSVNGTLLTSDDLATYFSVPYGNVMPMSF